MPPKSKKGGARTLDVKRSGSVTWINVTKPTLESLKQLKKRFPAFLDIDLKDCLPPYQRPKLLERDSYLFMVLIFPVYDKARQSIRQYELDLFIGKGFVVTSHEGGHEALEAMAADCADGTCVVMRGGDALRTVGDILHSMIVSCFPLLTNVSNDLVQMEAKLFEETDGELTKDMLRIKTDIVDFRQAMQGFDATVGKLLERGRKFFDVDKARAQFDDIAEHGREIRSFLDNDRDTVNALYESHLAMVTHRTNQATKTLTGLAFIIFPMTLVATVFSMRAEHMPIIGRQDDFWILLAIIFGVMLALVLFMKRKRLL